MIDSLEYYHNRDEHGNLRTQGGPQPIDEPTNEEELEDNNYHEPYYDEYGEEDDDDETIDRKYRGEED